VRGEKIAPAARPDALLLYSPALDMAEDAYFVRLMKEHGESRDYSPAQFVNHKLPPMLIIQREANVGTRSIGQSRALRRFRISSR
jgi:acetyl esterase